MAWELGRGAFLITTILRLHKGRMVCRPHSEFDSDMAQMCCRLVVPSFASSVMQTLIDMASIRSGYCRQLIPVERRARLIKCPILHTFEQMMTSTIARKGLNTQLGSTASRCAGVHVNYQDIKNLTLIRMT